MRSIHRTLVTGTILGTAVVLVAAGVLLYSLVRSSLIAQFDRGLEDRARLLASSVEVEDDGAIEVEFDELDMHEFTRDARPAYLQLWSGEGDVLYRSPSLGGGDLGRYGGSTGEPAFRSTRLPDGRAGRCVALLFRPGRFGRGESEEGASNGAPVLRLVAARGTEGLQATLSMLKAVLLAVGALALAVSVAILGLTVRRGLGPLKRLAGEIRAFDERDLSGRIEIPRPPAELEPIVSCLNQLLGRVEAAFERERSFSADVAHELRTPLAGLRSTIEVTLSRARERPNYEHTLRESLQITKNMQRLVEHLLALVRLESGQIEVHPEAVRLDEVIHDAWEPLSSRARERRLQVTWRLEDAMEVQTDRSLVTLVVRNLLQNAVDHADEGGSVLVEASRHEGRVNLRVKNSGSLVAKDQVQQVFRSFWRGDEARTNTGLNCGLGLSLVARAVEVLGGEVSVQTAAREDFEVTVRLPKSSR